MDQIVKLLIIVVTIYAIGVLGYKSIFDTDWLNAFYYASTTSATIGLIASEDINTVERKVFLSIYVLTASCVFLVLAGYIVHYFLIK